MGAGLAVSGAVMQCVLHNPLASASTLGVSQGSAFGAALGIAVFGGGVVNSGTSHVAVEVNSPWIVTLCAFLFGMVSTAVILGLSRLKRGLGPGGMVLAGTALSALFSGGKHAAPVFCGRHETGSRGVLDLRESGKCRLEGNPGAGPGVSGSFLYFMGNRWNYNALQSGADTAKSLGVNTRAVTLAGMTVCSFAAAVAVAFVGIISFIGLAAPHIMRKFVGDDYRFSDPLLRRCRRAAPDSGGYLWKAYCIAGDPPGGGHHFLSGRAGLPAAFDERGRTEMMEVKNLSFRYRGAGKRILDRISFRAEKGSCLAVLGNNGAGKSTLLKCMSRICRAGEGSVLVDGEDILRISGKEMARKIAYVPQSSQASHTMVFDEVLLGRKPYIKWDITKEDQRLVMEILEQLELTGFASRYLDELSGGERQKVVLARALAQQPEFLLLDEPTSSLDPRNQQEMLRTVRNLAEEQGLGGGDRYPRSESGAPVLRPLPFYPGCGRLCLRRGCHSGDSGLQCGEGKSAVPHDGKAGLLLLQQKERKIRAAAAAEKHPGHEPGRVLPVSAGEGAGGAF